MRSGTLAQQGVIRKFGAILRHQRAGITRNAMVIWAVPPDRTEEAGGVFASFREITHCYERRPPFEGRYNLFTMIHTAEGQPGRTIARISSRVGDQRLPGAREPGGVQEKQYGIFLGSRSEERGTRYRIKSSSLVASILSLSSRSTYEAITVSRSSSKKRRS